MKRFHILLEFWQFITTRKKWWILPIAGFLLLLGIIVISTKGSVLAPLIYSFF